MSDSEKTYYEEEIAWPRLRWGLYSADYANYYIWRDIFKAFPSDADLKDEDEIEPEENSGEVFLGAFH